MKTVLKRHVKWLSSTVLGHSAAIHTEDAELAKEFGRLFVRFVLFGMLLHFGGIGDVYNAFIPSLTLGCGSYGRNSVGDNVSFKSIKYQKVGRRKNMQWFKVPSKIYFECDSIQYLQK